MVTMENSTMEAEYDEPSLFFGWHEQWKNGIVPSESNIWSQTEKVIEGYQHRRWQFKCQRQHWKIPSFFRRVYMLEYFTYATPTFITIHIYLSQN
ncbi:nwd2 [Moniliophthora roreri]|nr:nwd2 [Moniliophthora roreri]